MPSSFLCSSIGFSGARVFAGLCGFALAAVAVVSVAAVPCFARGALAAFGVFGGLGVFCARVFFDALALPVVAGGVGVGSWARTATGIRTPTSMATVRAIAMRRVFA